MLIDAPTAVITGAARRLGAALAVRLHSEGWNIVLHHHQSVLQAEQLRAQCHQQRPDSVMLIAANLSDPDAVVEMGKTLAERLPRLDALVNNAAIYEPTPMGQGVGAQMRRVLTVNALAPLLLCDQLSGLLSQRAGRVLNMLDTVPLRTGYAAYDMSKAALTAMTKTLARELAPVAVYGLALGDILPPIGTVVEGEQQHINRPALTRAIEQAVALLSGRSEVESGQFVEVFG